MTRKASIFYLLAFSVFDPAKAQDFTPQPLLGLAYDEQQPVPGPDGELYFTLAFHPGNLGAENDPGDVWYLPDAKNETEKNPIKVTGLSTASYDLLTGFLHKDTALVYHEDFDGQQVLAKYFRAEGQNWEFIELLSLPGFRVLGKHFSGRLHASGEMLIMAMNSYGSYGNEDLYICLKQDGEWARPINLGPIINTFQQELSPFLAEGGDRLYFASNAHGITSGKKIFYSERMDESWTNWSKPIPLELPANQGMDLYFVEAVENNILYYTNTRTSDGYGNILTLNQELISLLPEGPIVDQEKMAAPADTLIESKPRGEENLNMLEESLPEIVRRQELPIDRGLDHEFENLEKGAVFQLEQVKFKQGSSGLSDSGSLAYVQRLSHYLKNHPNVQILIEGHTDAYGNRNLNKELSLNRAAAIRDILVDNGVEFERIQINGWGGTKPITSNQTAEGREKNRRVELVILDK